MAQNDRPTSSAHVWVAVIGLIGVIATGIISKWDVIFPRDTPKTSPFATTAAANHPESQSATLSASTEAPLHPVSPIKQNLTTHDSNEPAPQEWELFRYTTTSAGWTGEFRRGSSGWREFNKDHPAGRHWATSVTSIDRRIRLTDGESTIEIDPQERLIYYTDPGWESYPVPQPLYKIVHAE